MKEEKALATQKANTIRAYLEQDSVKRELARAVPKHLPVDRLLRVAMTSIQQTSKLLDCTPISLLRCVMTCASLGLEPDQFLGQAYLVPFWNSKKNCFEAQLIPGYRGYISLARRSGEVQSVSSQVVYTHDHFVLEYGINEKLEHRPVEGDRGKPRGAYVIFKYKDGGHSFDYMSAEDIEKIRARSKAKDDGPWVTDWDEMGKKTVIKRHAKLAPLSVEFQKAVALEDRAHMGESQEGIFDDFNNGVIDIKEDTEALIKKFDANIPDKTNMGYLNTYLKMASDTFEKPVDEIKTEAAKDLDNFWTQYRKWESKQKPEKKEETLWNPYTSELQQRYPNDKADILKAEALKRNIAISGLLPREVHRLLLESFARDPVGKPLEKPKTPPPIEDQDKGKDEVPDEPEVEGFEPSKQKDPLVEEHIEKGEEEPKTVDEAIVPCSRRGDTWIKPSFCKAACPDSEACADYKNYLENLNEGSDGTE